MRGRLAGALAAGALRRQDLVEHGDEGAGLLTGASPSCCDVLLLAGLVSGQSIGNECVGNTYLGTSNLLGSALLASKLVE